MKHIQAENIIKKGQQTPSETLMNILFLWKPYYTDELISEQNIYICSNVVSILSWFERTKTNYNEYTVFMTSYIPVFSFLLISHYHQSYKH